MRQREFIKLLAGTAVALPVAVRARHLSIWTIESFNISCEPCIDLHVDVCIDCAFFVAWATHMVARFQRPVGNRPSENDRRRVPSRARGARLYPRQDRGNDRRFCPYVVPLRQRRRKDTRADSTFAAALGAAAPYREHTQVQRAGICCKSKMKRKPRLLSEEHQRHQARFKEAGNGLANRARSRTAVGGAAPAVARPVAAGALFAKG